MIKKTVFMFWGMLALMTGQAQPPHSFKYQAVARSPEGIILAEKSISLRIGILRGDFSGVEVFSETHHCTTDKFGLFTVDIGTGVPVSGDIQEIDWGGSTFFLKLGLDADGGSNYEWLGTSQLLAVPYALQAGTGNLSAYTQAQRDAIPDPAEGLVILNLTSGCINIRLHHNWQDVCPNPCSPLPTQANAGPDQMNVPGTSAVLAANTPEPGETGTWNIVSGTGGSFLDIFSPTTDFSGSPGSEYVLTWTISNDCGTSTDSVRISFAMAFPDCGLITDIRDGKTYQTVVIGTQCWMKQNLNAGTRIDGGVLPVNNGIIEKYCYDNSESMCDSHGALYNWNELTSYLGYSNVQGICPDGWHLPTLAEWNILIAAVNADGNALKKIGQGIPPYGEGTNTSGFSALLCGQYQHSTTNPLFQGFGNNTGFYTRSTPSGWPSNYGLNYDDSIIHGFASNPVNGYSVRCLKN